MTEHSLLSSTHRSYSLAKSSTYDARVLLLEMSFQNPLKGKKEFFLAWQGERTTRKIEQEAAQRNSTAGGSLENGERTQQWRSEGRKRAL